MKTNNVLIFVYMFTSVLICVML